jgi:4-hydroxy-3-methylbut-2-enyl diphosphate reductase
VTTILPAKIYRKGLNLKQEVRPLLVGSYHSALVARVKEEDYQYRSGRLIIYLAREFGFCYGVDRAVDYAYQTRKRFPDREVFLTGEIIHNPHVNSELRRQGIRFLSDPTESMDRLTPDQVVILPAFGVTIETLARLMERGCTLVDTTCGSVLNVWKNVKRYTEEGFTSVIHGKHWHEETQATASQALNAGLGRYLIVLNETEATTACDYIRGHGDKEAFLSRFAQAISPGFDPDRDLRQIGCANQTTMLSTESLAIGEMFRQAILDRYGAQDTTFRFRAFDTICSATQDRQDAVEQLLTTCTVDLMIVIGGYNSSNTCNLAKMTSAYVPTFHIADPSCLVSAAEMRHKPVGGMSEQVAEGWLPSKGPVAIGLTSGASTPDSVVERTMHRLSAVAAEAPE